ncbi:MAG: HAD-IA family hydrolase [Deltaproteobacteria bacterium]|nr:HAD-IA family hydrolase [Deltaproteobacteria bacterium]
MKEKPHVDLIVFDLDGTLIDSCRDLTLSVNDTLHSLGYPPLEESLIAQYVGQGVTPLLQRSLERYGSKKVEEARSIFLKRYEEHLLDNTRLFPGVADVLLHFVEKHLAILTNKPYSLTEKILSGLNIDPLFSIVIGGDSLEAKKPDPGGFRFILNQLGILPREAMIVGDNPVDIQTGKRVGSWTCGVTYGYSAESDVKNAHPDFLISTLSALQNIIL